MLQRARRRIDPVLLIMVAVIAVAMVAAFVCRIDSVTQLSAGTTGLPPTDIRVALVTHGGVGDLFWNQVAAGAYAAQREFGLEVRFDGSGDVQEQIRLVDNAVSQGFDVIVVSLADPDAMEDSIRGAVAAGITVFSINSGEERGREFGALLLILDEPTSALGVRQSAAVLQLIRRVADRGTAVVFGTPQPRHAYLIGDRFSILQKGGLRADLQRGDLSLDELTHAMAGGRDVQELELTVGDE